MELFNKLPNEILEKIFFPLDYATLYNTQCLQNKYIRQATKHDTFEGCIQDNNYTSMSWALQHKHVQLHTNMYFTAIELHSTSALQWLFNAHCKKNQYISLCAYAAEFGNLLVLQCLMANGCELNTNTLARTIQYKHYTNIEFLLQHNCVADYECMQRAAENNQLQILQLCHTRGGQINKHILAYAAAHNDTHILEWLHSIHCEMDMNAIANALYKKSYAALHWLLQHNCECTIHALQVAVQLQLYFCVQLLLRYNCPLSAHAFDFAAQSKKIEILDLLLAAHCPYNNSIFTTAAQVQDINVSRWLNNNLLKN